MSTLHCCHYGLRDQRQRPHKITRTSRIRTTIPTKPNHTSMAKPLYSLPCPWPRHLRGSFEPRSSASSSATISDNFPQPIHENVIVLSAMPAELSPAQKAA